MDDSVQGPSAVAVHSQHTAGVTVRVLRHALDLMETEGEAIVTMINSAPGPGDVVDGAIAALSDPLTGQQVDLLA